LIIIYFLPLSAIAIIPGVILSFVSGATVLALVDLSAFFVLAMLAFNKGISIAARKIIFISLIYFVACVLFYFLGPAGPGMLYFVAASLFAVLVFEAQHAYWTAALNAAICVAIGLAIYFNAIPALSGQYSVCSWATIATNVVILSLLIIALMPRLFKKMEESNERFLSVTKATSDTIWDWDIEGGSIQYNATMGSMFGYSQADISTRDTWWLNKMHPDDFHRVQRKLKVAIARAEKNFQLEYRFLCADGSYKHVMNRASAVHFVDNKPTRIIGVMQDIDKVRNYITAIEEQNNRLRQISWINSHKVRRPVATILGLSPLLNMANEDLAENQRVLEGIVESCNELDAVLKEVNALADAIGVIKRPS
jgi:PAS domain S-box-containing protein